MGTAARRLKDERTAERQVAPPRAVASGKTKGRSPKTAPVQKAPVPKAPTRAAVASPLTRRCRVTFRSFLAVLAVVSAFGMVRVTLSANAAETSAMAFKVKKELRAEQEQGQTLEMYRGALAEPSRIESIAATSMRMTKPADVRYIRLPSTPATSTAPSAARKRVSSASVSGVFDGIAQAAARIAAGEAQVLLASGSGLDERR